MRCIILNRNYPPNAGVTGYSVAELAAYLHDQGVEVHIITVGGNYSGGVRYRNMIQTAKIHRVRNIYDGKNKIFRLVASLIEGRNMAKKAVSLGISPVITLTDPPLLSYWVAKVCRKRQIPWIYWTMDIYPEAFVAAGLAKVDGILYRHFKKELLRSAPKFLISLGAQQAEYLQNDTWHMIPTAILPCGVDRIERVKAPPEWVPPSDKITYCYIGNLGQAHDPCFVEAVIAAMDPEKHHFILSVYGIHAPRLLSYVAGLQHVTVVDSVDRTEFGWIDVHLASLELVWDHVCVPSKAVSAVCAGSCLLLCSSERGDNWHLLQEASWRIEPGERMSDNVVRIIDTTTPSLIAEKRTNAVACAHRLVDMKTAAMADIRDAVISLQQAS